MKTLEPVDLNNKIAYYLQVKKALQDRIKAGALQPGDKLPSEAELYQLMGVSRTVIRQALMELEHEGLVYKRKGKGSFIAQPKLEMGLGAFTTTFSEQVAAADQKVETRILFQGLVPADEKISKLLEIPVEHAAIRVDRIRLLNDEPVRLVRTWLSNHHCASLVNEDFSQKLQVLLQIHCGLVFDHGDRLIEAVGANEEESKIFGIKLGTPVFILKNLNFIDNNTPVEYSEIVMPADRSRIEFQFYKDQDNNVVRIQSRWGEDFSFNIPAPKLLSAASS